MSNRNVMLLSFASGVPYGCRDGQRFELAPKITCCKKMCKQSSQQSDPSCFCTNTRTTHTKQNKPYRLGAVRAGVVGARGCCFAAATVPVAVVFPCGVCCCIPENIQSKIINRNRALPSSSTNQSAQHRVREQHTQGRTSPTGLARAWRSKISDFFYLIFVLGLLPKIWGPLPDFDEHSLP